MLEVMQAKGPVVAFRASGTLSAEDYDRMTGEIDRRLSEHERVGLFADISELHGLTLAALGRDLTYALGKLGELHRLARVSVVSEKPWLRAWSQFAWLLVPQATVRTFQHADRDAALAWVSELPAEAPQRGLRWLETNRPGTYAFVWNGTITREDVDHVIARLEHELRAHDSVRLLARIEHMSGIRPQALFNSTYARVKALGLKKVERYAVVAHAGWLERYLDFAQQLSPVELRFFPLEKEQEAWAWLEAEPAGPSASDRNQGEARA
jgi:hypothetical protein